MKDRQTFLYAERFLESFTGATLMKDTKVAIMELIANSWDAGATQVDIIYPTSDNDVFSITDNGHGMTEGQFNTRFRTLAYNRTAEQGNFAEIPASNNIISKRPAFGRNGKGRFAAFAFGEEFVVKTWRDGNANSFRVYKARDNSVLFPKIGEAEPNEGHGTEIRIKPAFSANMTEGDLRTEIGMRFLSDPNFFVTVNGIKVTFSDIPEENLKYLTVDVEGVGQVKITVSDVQ